MLKIVLLAQSLMITFAYSAEYKSPFFQSTIHSSETVPSPRQAELILLPYMKTMASRIKGSSVLDIGTGSGIIALYASQLGATKVIATDIDEHSLKDARLNSQRLKLPNIETRLVQKNAGAFDSIEESEKFDFIISNPPYTLDLSATSDGDFTDSSLLGVSIIKGLKSHLRESGAAILLYRDVFYHEFLVKLARLEGYKVTSYSTDRVTPNQMAVLYNSYLDRIAQKIEIKKENFTYDPQKDEWAKLKQVIVSDKGPSLYPGLIVVEKK